jgi:hypothetical protein
MAAAAGNATKVIIRRRAVIFMERLPSILVGNGMGTGDPGV